MERADEGKERLTFTDSLRVRFKGVINPVASFFNKIGLMPNTITILGLVGNVAGAYLLSQGKMFWGGLVILLMGPVDALDGAMARLRGEPTKFGAFVDSVSDRYSELIIFLGLLYYYLQSNNHLGALLVYLAAAGSVLVSYMRARGHSLGYDTKVGVMTRVERYLVLVLGLLFNLPLYALAIIAVLANFTALQRILDVRQKATR